MDIYILYQNDTPLFGVCGEGEAQEMVLALTQEYIYEGFNRNLQESEVDTVLWLFQHAPKYGWNQFSYKKLN